MSRNRNRENQQQQQQPKEPVVQGAEADQMNQQEEPQKENEEIVVENLQPEVISQEQAAQQEIEKAGSTPVEAPVPVARAEIRSEPEAPVPEVKVVQTKAAIVVDSFEEKIKALRKSGSTMQKLVIDFFDSHMVNLAPGKQVSDKDLYRGQFNMWSMFDTILNHSSDDEFQRLWSMILAMFDRLDTQDTPTALADTHIYRGLWMWPNGDKRAQAWQQIVNLIKLTKNQENRQKGLRQVDMEKALRAGFTDKARARLLSFYGK